MNYYKVKIIYLIPLFMATVVNKLCDKSNFFKFFNDFNGSKSNEVKSQ